MIYIENMPEWGFGNRILYYNNLRQLSEIKQEQWSCLPWHGHQYFVGDLLNGARKGGQRLEPCLGEKFFEWDTVFTRNIFELVVRPEVPSGTCAVHFRGTDFHSWNPDAVLDYKYYNDSIQEIKNEVQSFALFTDDPHLDSFKRIKKYLLSEGITFFEGVGTRENYINDFSLISECDYIISSPSTFCVSAGFIGKEKKIIHSEKWVKDRANKNDKFWVDLLRGGNKNYSIWKLI